MLWIGYLQWHIRTFGGASVAEPVIHDFGNIEHRDAVLAYDGQEPMRDEAGNLVQRWDGKSFKTHQVTGEKVPDEAALVPQWRYLNPRAADWPTADFVVGNPPFIGARRVRSALGDGYVDALRGAFEFVPDTADFVCHWWEHAAQAASKGTCRRFGLITTNSIVQGYSRPVLERHLGSDGTLALCFAIADHPWVQGNDGAAVRVAMTVACRRASLNEVWLGDVVDEPREGEPEVVLRRVGRIGPALFEENSYNTIAELTANERMCFQGVVPAGDGFKLTSEEVAAIGFEAATLPPFVREYLIGRDLVQKRERRFILDFFGLEADEVRMASPRCFQRLLDRVKPERDENKRQTYRDRWWIFAEPRPAMRSALKGLQRFIATPYTARHRVFTFVEPAVLPDAMAYAIASSDAAILGVLSATPHLSWCRRYSGRMGVGNDSRYTSRATFLPFPFPSDDTGLTPLLQTRIRNLAEQLDAHRKTQQAAQPELTLTGMYNVLEKLRSGEPLTLKDKLIHAQGLVSVLKSLHDELDAAVLQAYGWADLQSALTDHSHPEVRAVAVETLLDRLVALNARRTAEEANGHVRWLRPEFQQRGTAAGVQERIDVDNEAPESAEVAAPAASTPKRPWPAGLPEQIKAVAEVLAASPRALSLAEVEARFASRGRWRDRLPTILDTLEALGRARRQIGADARWQSA